MKTKDKITECALSLFNASGSDQISTNHIAEAVGISIGNLYYHYKNKEEIVFDIWQRMVEETDPDLEIKSAYSIKDLEETLDNFQSQLWDYRFFQLELNQLLSRNITLKKAYSKSKVLRLKKMKQLFVSMRTKGLFAHSFTDNLIDSSLIASWIIMDFWLSYQSTSETIETYKASELILNILKPYIKEELL